METLIVHWNVDPAILRIGGFELRWYSLLFVAGFVLGWFIFQGFFRREKTGSRSKKRRDRNRLVFFELMYWEQRVLLLRPSC